MKISSLNLTIGSILCLFSGDALAKPVSRSLPIETLETVDFGKRFVNPHILLNQTLARLGRKAPANVARSAERAAADLEHNTKVKRGGKISIKVVSTFQEIEYLLPVTVGAQRLNVELDTSDQQTWVFSTLLAPEDRGSHNLYNPGNKKPIKEWTSFYHSEPDGSDRGYAHGVPYADKVVIGSFTATSAHVGAATAISPVTKSHKSDGSIGMGLNRAYCEGYCDSFIKSKPFNANTYLQAFGLDIKETGQSTWQFGGYDSKTYPFKSQSWSNVIMSTAEIPWINEDGQWLLDGGSCFINKKKTTCGHKVIVSSATPLVIMPSAIVDNYYSKVPGATWDEENYTWYFPCNVALPSFGLDFDPINHPEGSHTPGKYLNLGSINDGSGRCFGALQRSVFSDLNVIGTSFLKAHYVGFEAYLDNGKLDGGAVMFAPKVVV